MRQTDKIFFCLAFAFFVFITSRGELPAYIAILTGRPGNKNAVAAGGLQKAGADSGIATINQAGKLLNTALNYSGAQNPTETISWENPMLSSDMPTHGISDTYI